MDGRLTDDRRPTGRRHPDRAACEQRKGRGIVYTPVVMCPLRGPERVEITRKLQAGGPDGDSLQSLQGAGSFLVTVASNTWDEGEIRQGSVLTRRVSDGMYGTHGFASHDEANGRNLGRWLLSFHGAQNPQQLQRQLMRGVGRKHDTLVQVLATVFVGFT
jgi:hypothetical protein